MLGLQSGRQGPWSAILSRALFSLHELPLAVSPQVTHLATASWASWLGGGTRKHTEGTAASLLGPLSTFQWDGWAGPTSWHWSPLCTVTWDSQSSKRCSWPACALANPAPLVGHSLAQPLPPPACSHTRQPGARGPAQGGQGCVASAAQWPWPAWPGLRGAPCTHSAAPSRPVGEGR